MLLLVSSRICLGAACWVRHHCKNSRVRGLAKAQSSEEHA